MNISGTAFFGSEKARRRFAREAAKVAFLESIFPNQHEIYPAALKAYKAYSAMPESYFAPPYTLPSDILEFVSI